MNSFCVIGRSFRNRRKLSSDLLTSNYCLCLEGFKENVVLQRESENHSMVLRDITNSNLCTRSSFKSGAIHKRRQHFFWCLPLNSTLMALKDGVYIWHPLPPVRSREGKWFSKKKRNYLQNTVVFQKTCWSNNFTENGLSTKYQRIICSETTPSKSFLRCKFLKKCVDNFLVKFYYFKKSP